MKKIAGCLALMGKPDLRKKPGCRSAMRSAAAIPSWRDPRSKSKPSLPRKRENHTTVSAHWARLNANAGRNRAFEVLEAFAGTALPASAWDFPFPAPYAVRSPVSLATARRRASMSWLISSDPSRSKIFPSISRTRKMCRPITAAAAEAETLRPGSAIVDRWHGYPPR